MQLAVAADAQAVRRFRVDQVDRVEHQLVVRADRQSIVGFCVDHGRGRKQRPVVRSGANQVVGIRAHLVRAIDEQTAIAAKRKAIIAVVADGVVERRLTVWGRSTAAAHYLPSSIRQDDQHFIAAGKIARQQPAPCVYVNAGIRRSITAETGPDRNGLGVFAGSQVAVELAHQQHNVGDRRRREVAESTSRGT